MVNNEIKNPIDSCLELSLLYAKRYLDIYNDLEKHNISFDTVIDAFRSGKELTLMSVHGLGPKSMARLLTFPLNYLSEDRRTYYETMVAHLLPIIEMQDTVASYLNPSLTFENYRESTDNYAAIQMAKEVIDSPWKRENNPLLLFGNSGCGKTHLVNAIGNAIKKEHTAMTVLYVTGDMFKQCYMEAVIKNRLYKFKERYYNVDVLILDNLHDLVGPGTQNCFFHVMDHLYQNDKQMVFTSCVGLDDLTGMLEHRIIEHLRWGRKVDMTYIRKK